MAETVSYYLSPFRGRWQVKRVGGIRILKDFQSKEEALAYAQVLMSKQGARFRLQNPDGTWQNI